MDSKNGMGFAGGRKDWKMNQVKVSRMEIENHWLGLSCNRFALAQKSRLKTSRSREKFLDRCLNLMENMKAGNYRVESRCRPDAKVFLPSFKTLLVLSPSPQIPSFNPQS